MEQFACFYAAVSVHLYPDFLIFQLAVYLKI